MGPSRILAAHPAVRGNRTQGRRWIPRLLAAGGALIFYLLLNSGLIEILSADKSLDRNMSWRSSNFGNLSPWIWLFVFLGIVPLRLAAGSAIRITRSCSSPSACRGSSCCSWRSPEGRSDSGLSGRCRSVVVLVLLLDGGTVRAARILSFAILTVALAAALLPVPFCAERFSNMLGRMILGRQRSMEGRGVSGGKAGPRDRIARCRWNTGLVRFAGGSRMPGMPDSEIGSITCCFPGMAYAMPDGRAIPSLRRDLGSGGSKCRHPGFLRGADPGSGDRTLLGIRCRDFSAHPERIEIIARFR